MAKKKDETPYERQERRHREERKRRHRQIADDWLRTRKPDVRPGLIMIATEINFRDGRELRTLEGIPIHSVVLARAWRGDMRDRIEAARPSMANMPSAGLAAAVFGVN